jgi:hypothetical protein
MPHVIRSDQRVPTLYVVAEIWQEGFSREEASLPPKCRASLAFQNLQIEGQHCDFNGLVVNVNPKNIGENYLAFQVAWKGAGSSARRGNTIPLVVGRGAPGTNADSARRFSRTLG